MMADNETASPVLDMSDLHVAFGSPDAPVAAVRGVSLRLERGRTLGIVGESGSGKSVTSRAMLGLFGTRARVRAERLRVCGVDVLDAGPRELQRLRRDHVSMVFQDPMRSLNPTLKIGRQIAEAIPGGQELGRAAVRKRVLDLLGAVRIPEAGTRIDAYPHQLSGGMRQRVVIAMAIAGDPQLVVADEPTTALDVTVQAQILNLLHDLQADFGLSIVLVTHDLGIASAYTDELAIMYAGRIVEAGPTPTVLTRMRMPYTRALFESIPQLDAPPRTELRTIKGSPPDLAAIPDGCEFHPRCPVQTERCRQLPDVTEDAHAAHWFTCWNPYLEDRLGASRG